MSRYFAGAATMFPDWVMLGVAHEDHVAIYASKDLGTAELRHEVDSIEVTTFGDPTRRFMPGREEFAIEATSYTMIVGRGSNYGEAFADLFRQWQPDDPKPRKEIGRRREPLAAPRRELTR